MQIINIDNPTPIDYNSIKGKVPTSADYDHLIDYECKIFDQGKLVCTYKKLSPEIQKILAYASVNSTAKKSQRTRGVVTHSSVFGSLPRVPVREDYCRFSADTKKDPTMFALLSKGAQEIWEEYKTNFPEMSQRFEEQANKIHPHWLKTKTPFSTININKNFAIKYHVDAGNMANVFSNVLISKKMAEGGYFVMPKYRVALAQDNGWLAIVDGVNVVHGVTPINLLGKTSYRNSFVFYTLENLKHCQCQPDEISRMKTKATERAIKRMDGNVELANLQEKRKAQLSKVTETA